MKIASVEVFILEFPINSGLDISPLQLNGPQFIETTFLRERLWKGGGRVALPEGPGLGVEVDEAYVRKHAVTVRMP